MPMIHAHFCLHSFRLTDQDFAMNTSSILLKSPFALLAVLACLGACAREESSPNSPTSTSPRVVEAAPAAAAPEPAPAPAPSRDACKSVSLEKLKALTGVDGEGTPSKSGGADVCTWTSASAKSAILQIYPSTSFYDRSREAFEGLQKQKAEDLSGLGDRAFYVGGKVSVMETATVSAQKGNTVISVQVMEMQGAGAALKAEATALTKEVLTGL